jgi:hypothetical protein
MKTIQLNKSSIDLPDSWEDLSYHEKLFTFELLSQLFAGAILPEIARLKMLIEYTGYKPASGVLVRLLSRKRESAEERETINFNLFRLSEQLDFAFTMEDNKIIPNYAFKTNPIPYLKIDKSCYTGKRFELDVTARTDMKAREFADCFDLLSAQRSMTAEADRDECVNQLCAILYPKLSDYSENMVCGHHTAMRRVPQVVKFGIVFWFTGIVRFYTEHPVYSILFNRNKAKGDEDDKIRIGMNEVSLFLQKEGYGTPDTMNLNDFFDAQIKALKDSVNSALAKGAKMEKISQESGIPLTTLYRLT